MTTTKRRRLVKDWEPIIPPSVHSKRSEFTLSDNEWTPERREWLRTFYPETENWRLALRLNTTEDVILRGAKSMRLSKSPEFQAWEVRDHTPQEGCPKGFHLETDQELQHRIEQERKADRERAMQIAKGFTFCSHSEKEILVAALTQAIEWGRESQPDLPHDFAYWE